RPRRLHRRPMALAPVVLRRVARCRVPRSMLRFRSRSRRLSSFPTRNSRLETRNSKLQAPSSKLQTPNSQFAAPAPRQVSISAQVSSTGYHDENRRGAPNLAVRTGYNDAWFFHEPLDCRPAPVISVGLFALLAGLVL